jgi:phage portal protein BeeE
MSLNGAFSLMLGTSQRSVSQNDGSYMTSFGGFFSLGNGKTGSLGYKKALTLTAVYNAVEQISNDIAKIPFSVNQKIDNNRESKPDHPAHRLIAYSPNSLMTTFI